MPPFSLDVLAVAATIVYRQRCGMANRSKHAADGKIIDRGVLVGDLPTDT